jgi:uncharacterized LabA/DUF88 family protein
MSRVIAYIDGANLYNGLRKAFGRRYLWLDVEKLMEQTLQPGKRLEAVNYFTARLLDNPAAIVNQAAHLDALVAHCTKLQITEGRFQRARGSCPGCQHQWVSYEEKETDSNIVAYLIRDAVLDRYDTAVLVSGDGDMAPGIRAVKELRPQKRVLVASPPRRQSHGLRLEAHGSFFVRADKIRQSLLPDTVMTSAGVVLKRPSMWR